MPQVAVLVLKMAGISGAFAALYDSVAQALQSCGRGDGGDSAEAEEPPCTCCGGRYDACRTARYAGVHVLWNGPYHVPKLLCLNWLFPGAPSWSIALKKTLVADLVFSPVETLGLLVLLQYTRDCGCASVPGKLREDFLPYQLTKWAGHVPAHFMAFMSAQSVVGIFVSGFCYKSVFEVLMAAIASRQAAEPSGALCPPVEEPSGPPGTSTEEQAEEVEVG
eukprot:TRINITY_DN15413_c0_g1_i1.p1 TRINITY_DN15413_c0_g1~~TRINITY_DN15413_c0_g1_i1.p1  ORF type:complete len:240 (+),score=67.98 TRINITY_DN15413_c0_g1_i1:58-720(+)